MYTAHNILFYNKFQELNFGIIFKRIIIFTNDYKIIIKYYCLNYIINSLINIKLLNHLLLS